MNFRNLSLSVILLITVTLIGGCQGSASDSLSQGQPKLNLFLDSFEPARGIHTDEKTIKIYFKRDMNPATLNSKTIEISEEKHSSILTNQFQFTYDSQNKLLILEPKNNDFDFGTDNIVTVKVSGKIQDQAGEIMWSEYSWSYWGSK